MKRQLAAAALAAASILIPVQDSLACTNLIVGREASADGSVICTYNCDGFGFAGLLNFRKGGRHRKGEKIAIHSWGDGPVVGYIDQADSTYSVMGYMNEKQVSIVETTFDGRLELVNEEGLLDYYTMMTLGLQRASNARDAIRVMTSLVAEYGYNCSGETITVCDKNEAWIMEIIGKGPERKGAVWVAVRVPDDCICAHANLSRIRQFPLDSPEECMYSPDVIDFAREMGFYSGPDENFSFRDAYCPIDFENVRYADTRVWSFFRHHSEEGAMDRYLPYLDGDFSEHDHLPLFIRPSGKVSLREIMDDMRDHFEGTPLDMTADISAGPWGMPVRPMPMTWTSSDGATYFHERPIATQKTAMTAVCYMRNYLPDALGGIMFFNCDDAATSAYVPIWCCTTRVPEAFRRGHNSYTRLDFKGAFWMNNFVANMVYPRYSRIYPDLREAQTGLEDFYMQDIESCTGKLLKASRRKIIRRLNRRSAEYASMMMERWRKLARLIIVKHNDLVEMPSENGEVCGGHPAYIGYDQGFLDRLASITGERYLMKEVIFRRER